MSSRTAPPASDTPAARWSDFPRFIWGGIVAATEGSFRFYAWMTFLSAVALVGLNAYGQQVVNGMVLTNMTDHVSWGLYIANFTFMVGVAAGGVMMVIPAYLYKDHEMHEVVIFGELLAVAAIIMAMAFVFVDLGRPDHFWHLIPGIGQFNWPLSMLSWDILVLNGYLVLNLYIVGYMLFMRSLGREPNPKWYVPFVFLSIVWAISIHTVTALLYAGLGGRPLWNSALLAPRFLASAFISGPAFIILTLLVLKRFTTFAIHMRPIKTLVSILRITVVTNLFMVASELFTEFYAGGHHTASAEYLFFGLHGHSALVPWIWTAVFFNIVAGAIFFLPKITENTRLLVFACILAFIGIWIEKGMGLVVAGFVPSALHEIVEYLPSLVEWRIMAGIWAFGLLVFSALIKITLPLMAAVPGHGVVSVPVSLEPDDGQEAQGAHASEDTNDNDDNDTDGDDAS